MLLHAGKFRTHAAGYLAHPCDNKSIKRNYIACSQLFTPFMIWRLQRQLDLGEKGCFEVGRVGQKRCRAGTVWELGGVHLHQRQPEIDGGD